MIISICAKCSDLCHIYFNNKERDGYVPRNLGIGGGDYIEFNLDTISGQIQGWKPLSDEEVEEICIGKQK